MKKLLITGAYGLVGSAICKLLEQYPELLITKVKFNSIFDHWPIYDERGNEQTGDYNKYDYIIHAAGYGQPQQFGKDKIKTIYINTQFTIQLFEMLKPKGRLLFVSSSEIYSGADVPYTEQSIGTTTPQHPRACYIEGKRCGEAICMAYKEQGIDVKIARLALAYGAAKLGDTRVLNQFIEQGLTGSITLRDAGQAVRTYCYVEDAAELLLKILFFGKDVVYNVGGFSTVTIAELAQEIGKIMNAKVIIPKADNSLQGAPENVCLDMTHTISEFDQHFTPLSVGLKKTIKQYGK